MIATLGDPLHALADGAGVIAASTTDRGAVATAMAQAMTQRARRVVADGVGEARTAIAAGAVPIETLQRFRRVREAVDEGWQAYLRVAVEFAAQRLATARTEAEALVALPGGIEVYADAALRLGVALGYLGRAKESEAVLQLALALDPDREITTTQFSPNVVNLVNAARVAQPGNQKLEITTSPPGAVIRVDGKDVGKSPLVLDVTRGQHLVVARLPDHRVVVQGVAVDEPAALALALERDESAGRLAAGAALGLDERAQQQLVDAVLRFADLDEVVLVAETVRRGSPTLLAQRCSGLPARCSAVVDIGFETGGRAAAGRAAWEAVRVGELRYPPTALSERGTTGPTGKCKWCRNPWVWTGVGAALVTGVIITLVVTSASKPPPIVGIDPDDFLP